MKKQEVIDAVSAPMLPVSILREDDRITRPLPAVLHMNIRTALAAALSDVADDVELDREHYARITRSLEALALELKSLEKEFPVLIPIYFEPHEARLRLSKNFEASAA